MDKATTIFFLELSKKILYYICLMKNNTVMNKVIKSVGYVIDTDEVLDDSQGLTGEFVGWVDDEDSSAEVTFEEGLKELKEYMLNFNADEDDINEVESKLIKLKEEVGNEGVWRTWGVEYDMSLAVIL